ncbi:MAG: carbohydrate binding family 9 domain-containing protein [Acidobacteria bacterium]|nr:carbohydrate binding family 9 domain-containing protein [Acidobacteriota bacterium]
MLIREHARALCIACSLLLSGAAGAFAQQPAAPADIERRTMDAVVMQGDESIVLDGRLDEGVWSRAVPASDFIQVDPANGQPATEPTEVRVVYNSRALYIGVICFDSEPDRWLGYQRRRDEFLASDDRFMWTIDTFLDARSGYFFEMNPSGLMADSLFGVNGDNRPWDGIWNARVVLSEVGWTIEIEIPFRTLNFNPNSDTWGINFQRTVRRKNEDSIWMGWARNQGLRRMATAGRVTGIRNVTQGNGLDVKPYGLFTAQSAPGRGDTATRGDASAGIDLFYNPTPLLRANLTVNTDFAQTEVDQRQVNLTRFSLFFPERRDFFLDGAIFFDFGSPTNDDLRVNPFFSRRIGLTGGGEPQPIDFGTKVTGQIGGQDVGLLHVQTGEEGDVNSEAFTVARVKRRMLQQSYVGAMYTRRDVRGLDLDASQTIGLDARFATNTFAGSQNLSVAAWFLNASQPGVSSETSAFGAIIDYPNDRWNANFDMRELQRNFNPSVGFITRTDYRRYRPQLNFAPRPRNNRIVRQYTYGVTMDVQTTLDNDLIVRSLEATAFQVNLQSQDTFSVIASQRYEKLDLPFRVNSAITLPVGSEYTFSRVRVNAQTANRRVVALNGRVETGQFYSGTRHEFVANLTFRLAPGYIVYLANEINRVRLAEGRFTTKLVRVVGETQFSPFVAWVNNLQYDTQSAVLGWQSRFRWIVRPGNDLYFVYTHNWLDDPVLNRFASLDRRFATKVLYTRRF